jgi:hypothetical protein
MNDGTRWDFPGPHTIACAPGADDIDGLNHTNNGVYVRWCQDAGWSHSAALGLTLLDYQQLDRAMAIRRGEYDYLLATSLGEALTLATWLVATDGLMTMARPCCAGAGTWCASKFPAAARGACRLRSPRRICRRSWRHRRRRERLHVADQVDDLLFVADAPEPHLVTRHKCAGCPQEAGQVVLGPAEFAVLQRCRISEIGGDAGAAPDDAIQLRRVAAARIGPDRVAGRTALERCLAGNEVSRRSVRAGANRQQQQ